MKRLGYLGPPGTFTEMAAVNYLEAKLDNSSRLEAYIDIERLIMAIADGEVPAGIVPIENSLEGSVNITLDYLAHKVNLKIQAEITLPIVHNLIVKPGVKLDEIEKVISHPQALAQCRDNIKKYLGDTEIVKVNSTAEAVNQLSSRNEAAIGSRLAARRNNLEISKAGFQDESRNWTRFVLLSRPGVNLEAGRARQALAASKTSIILAPVKNRPGILHELLEEFARKNINLTKIESRPTRKTLGDYLFFIDFEGDSQDREIKEILKNLRLKSSYFKVLGSYARLEFTSEELAVEYN
ncbi:prephenate dehydratase [Halanaerobiaceae bacterium Z-7014]|uniref:Prephenate dehydratase n=1 Tax=Halonatronomonas betaini TaxID=2778430 RepID=A0A931AUP5_9FIRM|nr:prephenate dehydratase [Halonatronomonas betaini]MBF8437004.1 prephenate dehydratase [Halonatronomonas betaini]